MKKIFSAILVFVILAHSMACFAIEPEKLITEAYYYSASIYYCDAESRTVVFKNVKPMGKINDINRATAIAAEYVEIPIYSDGRFQDGRVVPMEDLNIYADSQVMAAIVRNAVGEMRVIALKFK